MTFKQNGLARPLSNHKRKCRACWEHMKGRRSFAFLVGSLTWKCAMENLHQP